MDLVMRPEQPLVCVVDSTPYNDHITPTISMRTYITGLFHTYADATAAYRALSEEDLDTDAISVFVTDPDGSIQDATEEPAEEGAERAQAALDGALTGGVIGGFTGTVLGLGFIALPGIGQMAASGALATGLLGAGVGSAGGSLVNTLIQAGLAEHDAETYAEAVRRGSILVVVQAPSVLTPRIHEIMNDHNAVQIENRVAKWQAQGWKTYDPTAPAWNISQQEENGIVRRSEQSIRENMTNDARANVRRSRFDETLIQGRRATQSKQTNHI